MSWLAARGHGNNYPKFKQLCHLLIRDYGGLPPSWQEILKMMRKVRSTDRRLIWTLSRWVTSMVIGCVDSFQVKVKLRVRLLRLVLKVYTYVDLGTRPRLTIFDHLSYIDALLHVSPAVSDTSNLSVDPGICRLFPDILISHCRYLGVQFTPPRN